jgi:hypothetical protein
MIRTKLMKHQTMIFNFTKDLDYFGIFAGFGTGKSLCALKFIDHHKIRKSLIVSTKTSIQCTWPYEIKLHTNFKYTLLVGTKQQKINALYMGLRLAQSTYSPFQKAASPRVIFLVNFDGVRNIYNELLQANLDLLIVDESTRIKSPKALRTKVLWALGQEIDKKCIMTGFPVTENLSDLYSQIKFLDNGETLGQSYYGFLHKYFTKSGYRQFPRKKSITEILKNIKPFCIRVSNKVLDLPPRTYEKIEIEPTKQQKELFHELNNYFRLQLGKVNIKTEYIFTLTNKCLEICDGYVKDKEGNLAKVDTRKDEVLFDLLDEIDIRKEKVIIWCAFLFSVNKLYKLLKKMGHKPLKLIGATRNTERVVDKFMHSPSHNVLLATQLKAAESITLTNCRYAIYYSNTWSQDKRSNSEARIYRKGSEKHKNIIYIDLVVKDSVEEAVYECLKRKKSLVATLMKQFAIL